MERSKKELLEKTYREFMKVGLESNEPNLLEGLVDENVMGFGTAMDEKILGIEEFKKLLNNQKIQSESLDIIWRNEPVHRFISEDENGGDSDDGNDKDNDNNGSGAFLGSSAASSNATAGLLIVLGLAAILLFMGICAAQCMGADNLRHSSILLFAVY